MARVRNQGQTHQKLTLKLDRRPTGNFWIDTGLVVLLQRFGEGEHPIDDILQWLKSQLLQRTGNKGEYYDPVTEQIREYEKTNWVYPTNLFIKISGSAPKIKIDGKDYFTQPPKFELDLKLSKKPDVCDLCGDTAPLTDAKMWMYPFVVDPQKFGTFYPSAKRGLRLCARCALAGLAGYLGWLWKTQGRDVLHFFIFHSELSEMKRLHEEVLQPLQIKETKGGTAPTAFSGTYIHETTLGLLLAIFAHVRKSDQLSDDARQLLASLLKATGTAPWAQVTLYAITGTLGQAFSMKALREFSKLQALYRLYEHWLEIIVQKQIDDNPHQRLVQIFRQFEIHQGQDHETIWRDKISWMVLEFSDPLPFVEQFLFEARIKEQPPKPLIRGTIEVLNSYVKEVLGMDEKFQSILAGFGHSLGATAADPRHNEIGLLYALRNAKNPEDFYQVLNDAQFRLQLTIPEDLLRIEKGERIVGTPWIRVKRLLSIYAMNAYLRKSIPKREETQETQEESL